MKPQAVSQLCCKKASSSHGFLNVLFQPPEPTTLPTPCPVLSGPLGSCTNYSCLHPMARTSSHGTMPISREAEKCHLYSVGVCPRGTFRGSQSKDDGEKGYRETTRSFHHRAVFSFLRFCSYHATNNLYFGSILQENINLA